MSEIEQAYFTLNDAINGVGTQTPEEAFAGFQAYRWPEESDEDWEKARTEYLGLKQSALKTIEECLIRLRRIDEKWNSVTEQICIIQASWMQRMFNARARMNLTPSVDTVRDYCRYMHKLAEHLQILCDAHEGDPPLTAWHPVRQRRFLDLLNEGRHGDARTLLSLAPPQKRTRRSRPEPASVVAPVARCITPPVPRDLDEEARQRRVMATDALEERVRTCKPDRRSEALALLAAVRTAIPKARDHRKAVYALEQLLDS